MKETTGRVFVVVVVVALVICSSVSFSKNNVCVESTLQSTFESQSLRALANEKEFKEHNIVFIKDVFDQAYFRVLKDGVLGHLNKGTMKRNNAFTSVRRAMTVKASDLRDEKNARDLYYSKFFIKDLRRMTGLPLENVSCNDEASMNVLVYNKPNDFISWHHDPNHYKGRRLTVLISLVNENAREPDKLSESELQYILDGKQHSIKMPPNSMLVFDGSKIKHRATSIGEGDTRIVLSFTYCDVCREGLMGYMFKKIKELVLGY